VSELARSLATAVVDGSQKLQVELQPHVNLIEICTESVKATDFENMTSNVVSRLRKNGTNAAREFFGKEAYKIREASVH
jgi:hypothetical protein